MNGSLIVGEAFRGCILQGPGILFNDSINNGAIFGPCPAENKGCKDSSKRILIFIIFRISCRVRKKDIENVEID